MKEAKKPHRFVVEVQEPTLEAVVKQVEPGLASGSAASSPGSRTLPSGPLPSGQCLRANASDVLVEVLGSGWAFLDADRDANLHRAFLGADDWLAAAIVSKDIVRI